MNGRMSNFIHIFFFCVCSTRLWGSIIGCAADAVPSAGSGTDLSFDQGGGNNSPTLHEGHPGIFEVHEQISASRQDSRWTSIGGTGQTLTNLPACETPGWQFIAGSGFKPRLDSFETSVCTSGLSCQPFLYIMCRSVINFNYIDILISVKGSPQKVNVLSVFTYSSPDHLYYPIALHKNPKYNMMK